jgi:hypothetical protein
MNLDENIKNLSTLTVKRRSNPFILGKTQQTHN